MSTATALGGTGTAPGQQTPGDSGLKWFSEHQTIATGFAFLLTALYVAPIFMVVFVAWRTDVFQEQHLLFEWFSAFIKTSDSTLNQFHKVLFPVISALSIIAFKGPPKRGMLLLAAFILFSFCISLVVGVMFDMTKTQDAVSGLENAPDPALVRAFFTRIQETLLMYFMMLIGIGVANNSK